MPSSDIFSIESHKDALLAFDDSFVSTHLQDFQKWIDMILAWRLTNRLPEITEVIIDGGRTFFGPEARQGLYQLVTALTIARFISTFPGTGL